MRRRTFIAGLGGAAAWPMVARTQGQRPIPVVGFLSGNSSSTMPNIDLFREGMKSGGFIEGQNFAFEFRSAEGQYDRLPALAAELVSRKVSVIVADGAVAAPLAAKQATTTIPIVFGTGSDPVKWGLVASLNRPGGNVTGVTLSASELLPKRVQLLRELVPDASVIGLLVNPNNPNAEPEFETDFCDSTNQRLDTEGSQSHQRAGLGTGLRRPCAIASWRDDRRLGCPPRQPKLESANRIFSHSL